MTLAERIADILSERGGNPLHLAYSEQWRIPAVAEKIAALFNREEVRPTDARNAERPALDTPPPSAHSQAGAFVPSEAQLDGLSQRLQATWRYPIASLQINSNAFWRGLAAAASAYAQECGAITSSPAEPPAATVEEIAEIIAYRMPQAEGTLGEHRDRAAMAAREIAALRPAPAVPEEIVDALPPPSKKGNAWRMDDWDAVYRALEWLRAQPTALR